MPSVLHFFPLNVSLTSIYTLNLICQYFYIHIIENLFISLFPGTWHLLVIIVRLISVEILLFRQFTNTLIIIKPKQAIAREPPHYHPSLRKALIYSCPLFPVSKYLTHNQKESFPVPQQLSKKFLLSFCLKDVATLSFNCFWNYQQDVLQITMPRESNLTHTHTRMLVCI